jgi:2-keto-4-pentenoate hydratase
MKDSNIDLSSAAQRLATAFKTNQSLTALPEAERPTTLDESYVAQAEFINLLGEGIAGWKLAGASPRGLRGEAPNAPVTGLLVPSRVVTSGAVVQLPPGRNATLEIEVSLRFSRDVAPAEEAFDASSMIEEASLTIEVVCSRFVDRKVVGQPSFVADNVGFHTLVRGDKLDFLDSTPFAGDAELLQDGNPIAGPLSGDDRTNPYLALTFLWSQLSEKRLTIPKGAVVTTGTLSVPVDVTQSGHYQGRLGNASVSFTLACDART